MECSRCGEWQIKHTSTCVNCGASNWDLVVRTDDGSADVTGTARRLLEEKRSARSLEKILKEMR
jgi:ribosomal protein L32